MSDFLQEMKTYFILGMYQSAINMGTRIRQTLTDGLERLECDIYIYRSFIEQGNSQLVVDEIKCDNSSIPLAAIYGLANIMMNNVSMDDHNTQVLSLLESWMQDPLYFRDEMVLLISGIMFYRLGQISKAWSCVANNTLVEARLFSIHILLGINRVDLALKELEKLQQIQESAVPTLLASSWINLFMGADKLRDALATYEYLIKNYEASHLLYQSAGLCYLKMHLFKESETFLLLALEKNPRHVETISNMIVMYQHSGKMEESIRFQTQLKSLDPRHPVLTRMDQMEQLFDSVAIQLSQPVNATTNTTHVTAQEL